MSSVESVSKSLKENLINQAKSIFISIEPCQMFEKFDDRSFTIREGKLIFWFNLTNTKSTKTLKMEI